jgi:predicted RNA methylase
VIAENLSTWLVTEPQIPILNHINRHLVTAAGTRLPATIFNCLELAETQCLFEDLVEVRTHHFEFTGIRPSRLLSGTQVFSEVDLGGQNPLYVDGTASVRVVRDGVLNSLRLTSALRVHGDITFDSSDSLMPPVIVPLGQDIRVRVGDTVTVSVRYQVNSSWEQVECEAAGPD